MLCRLLRGNGGVVGISIVYCSCMPGMGSSLAREVDQDAIVTIAMIVM